MNSVNISDYIEKTDPKAEYFLFPFYKDGKPVESGKRWGMTLLSAGTMRFRWNEENENRRQMLFQIARKNKIKECPGNCAEPGKSCDCKVKPVSLELIHSKIVYKLSDGTETDHKQGDGMITDNNLLMPVVTVADCVPLFFYDPVKKVFGVVHSGWKGTGIIGEAISLAVKEYGCTVNDICVAIGPHIGDCCYFIDKERADYFLQNFGPDCVEKLSPEKIEKAGLEYKLSLTKANLFVIQKTGVPEKNILVAEDCTCCSKFSSTANVFGSFRRQAAFLPPEVDADTRSRNMIVQAAFVI